MNFLEWKTEIVNRLIKIGFDKEYAKSKANSVRGCYYDNHRFPEPTAVIKTIMHRSFIGLLTDEQLEAYRIEYADAAI